ncbi:ribonuclease H-like domain-containing protein [Hypoxylon sp. NC0597]|nr:ribonuclease H-like domain-containing protein [Hypoxylon sp. NC0597]
MYSRPDPRPHSRSRSSEAICPRCNLNFSLDDKPRSEVGITTPLLEPVDNSFLINCFEHISNTQNSIFSGIQPNPLLILRATSDSIDRGDTFRGSQIPGTHQLAVSTGAIPQSSEALWAYPTKFIPPSPTSTPLGLFPNFTNHNHSPPVSRFVHHLDLKLCLVFVDGVYLGNGKDEAREGWAVYFGHDETVRMPVVESGSLIPTDPSDYYQAHQRATLRAALAALQYDSWTAHGFETLVICSSSDYLVEGATTWLKTWVEGNWEEPFSWKDPSTNQNVRNRDLWEIFFEYIQKWNNDGLTVKFWKIPKALNTMAHEAAKLAAGGQLRLME